VPPLLFLGRSSAGPLRPLLSTRPFGGTALDLHRGIELFLMETGAPHFMVDVAVDQRSDSLIPTGLHLIVFISRFFVFHVGLSAPTWALFIDDTLPSPSPHEQYSASTVPPFGARPPARNRQLPGLLMTEALANQQYDGRFRIPTT